jgi:seryl-tRNA synthetase
MLAAQSVTVGDMKEAIQASGMASWYYCGSGAGLTRVCLTYITLRTAENVSDFPGDMMQ